MKITVLSHDLSSNASMRAHRIAEAARTFADVELIGPAEDSGIWPALPSENWIRTVKKNRFPDFFASFEQLIDLADGDLLIAVKPHLSSYGAALLAADKRNVPVILDIDDLDIALAPPSQWGTNPSMVDVSRPGSAIYVSLLTKATSAAAAITVSSKALQRRFGGTLLPHGCDTSRFDPARFDRQEARNFFGFDGPTVLFAGTVRAHKGVELLAKAVTNIVDARLAVTCRQTDLTEATWRDYRVQRIPFIPYSSLPKLLLAADVIAIPQLKSTPAMYQTPMKVFEAMAMAKPIVATTVGDLPEILQGCGRVVPPEDENGLTIALTELLHDSEGSRSLGEKARSRCIDSYSISKIADILYQVLSPLLCKGSERQFIKHDSINVVPVKTATAFSDFSLPLLGRALDPAESHRHFQKALSHWGSFDLKEIRVVRHKPGRRCLIEYDLELPSRSVTLLGKMRRKWDAGNAHCILQSLWQSGFNEQSEDGIFIPEPIALIPEFRMSLQRKIDGTLSTNLLEDSDVAFWGARIADAIHKLHRSDIRPSKQHHIDEELAILEHRLNTVIKDRPKLAQRVARILEVCKHLARNLLGRPHCGIHRDFYQDQILVRGSCIYLLDLDLYSEGDPALDAGNFLGHLIELSLRKSGNPGMFEAFQNSFEERFLQRSNGTTRSAVQAYTTLTLARHIFLSTQFGDRLHSTDSILDLCEQRLAYALRS